MQLFGWAGLRGGHGAPFSSQAAWDAPHLSSHGPLAPGPAWRRAGAASAQSAAARVGRIGRAPLEGALAGSGALLWKVVLAGTGLAERVAASGVVGLLCLTLWRGPSLAKRPALRAFLPYAFARLLCFWLALALNAVEGIRLLLAGQALLSGQMDVATIQVGLFGFRVPITTVKARWRVPWGWRVASSISTLNRRSRTSRWRWRLSNGTSWTIRCGSEPGICWGWPSIHMLGDFLRAAKQWVNFSNTTRPHESLGYRSPDQYAKEQGLEAVPSITRVLDIRCPNSPSVPTLGLSLEQRSVTTLVTSASYG